MADYQTIIDTFVKDADAYVGRFNFTEFNTMIKGGDWGIINSEGELWREHRQFVLKFLRDFSGGRNLLQEGVLAEVASLVEKVERDLEAGVEEQNVAERIDIGVGSIINVLVFGFRFEGVSLC